MAGLTSWNSRAWMSSSFSASSETSTSFLRRRANVSASAAARCCRSAASAEGRPDIGFRVWDLGIKI